VQRRCMVVNIWRSLKRRASGRSTGAHLLRTFVLCQIIFILVYLSISARSSAYMTARDII